MNDFKSGLRLRKYEKKLIRQSGCVIIWPSSPPATCAGGQKPVDGVALTHGAGPLAASSMGGLFVYNRWHGRAGRGAGECRTGRATPQGRPSGHTWPPFLQGSHIAGTTRCNPKRCKQKPHPPAIFWLPPYPPLPPGKPAAGCFYAGIS